MDVPQPATASAPITIIVNGLRGESVAFTAPKASPLSSIHSTIHTRIPWTDSAPYILTTTTRHLVRDDDASISSLLSSPADTFLPLRLTVPMCGGKGGFGSQLRAQGGRMASRKKRNAGEQHGSSRNLEGRRLRTVTEAKALADYVSTKDELENKEKAERKKRWEDIVASTERKREEIVSGKARLDANWVEQKEEAMRKTREAALLCAQLEKDKEEERTKATAIKPVAAPLKMFGWDDEDDVSDSEEEEEVSEEDVDGRVPYEGKGKAMVA
jgi:hypothetical protein